VVTSPGLASNSVPSAICTRIVPDTWYWKCGASHRSVPASGLTSPGPAPARFEDEPADRSAAHVEDLGPSVAEAADVVPMPLSFRSEATNYLTGIETAFRPDQQICATGLSPM
jgi:hypothetical protein